MPTIHIIGAIRILMYFDDHNPPHFHAEYNEYEGLISIENLELIEGKIPNKQLKKVIEWASENQDKLMEYWTEFSN